jgi:hypothetical protein
MKKTKAKFLDQRERQSNHFDRKRNQYYSEAGCDQSQIDELNGIKHYWK